jgi:hypothetical protein
MAPYSKVTNGMRHSRIKSLPAVATVRSFTMATDTVQPVRASTPHNDRFIPIAILIVLLGNLIIFLLNENNWISKRVFSKSRGLLFLTNRGSHVGRNQRPRHYFAWDIINSTHLVRHCSLLTRDTSRSHLHRVSPLLIHFYVTLCIQSHTLCLRHSWCLLQPQDITGYIWLADARVLVLPDHCYHVGCRLRGTWHLSWVYLSTASCASLSSSQLSSLR